MSFTHNAIIDAVEAALADEARRLDAEQAVRGIDALDELRLHPILARGLTAAGFGVYAEQRFPAHRILPNQTEGDRCDLVLTPDGRDLDAPDREPTLFDRPDAVPLGDAFWLEVKTVGQLGEEGPNASYAAELVAAVRDDGAKLARDPGIAHAALLILLFAADERIATHDLEVAVVRGLDRGLPLGSPYRRGFKINDRLGNTVCALALIPVAVDQGRV